MTLFLKYLEAAIQRCSKDTSPKNIFFKFQEIVSHEVPYHLKGS